MDIAPADGNHTFSFTVSNPNGGPTKTERTTSSSDFFMNTTAAA